MKYSVRLLALILVTLIGGSASAAEPNGEYSFRDDRHYFHGYLWNTEITGNQSLKGLNLDVDSETGMSKKLSGGGDYGIFLTKRDRLNLSIRYFNHSGAVNKIVTFDKLKYATGAQLHMKSKWWEVGGARVLGNEKDANFEFLYGLVFVHRILDLTGTDVTRTLNQTGNWAKKVYAPYAGLFGQTRKSSRFLVEGHLKAGGFGMFDGAVNFGARLNAIEEDQKSDWYATVGYRKSVLKDEGANYEYSGPVFGVFGRF